MPYGVTWGDGWFDGTKQGADEYYAAGCPGSLPGSSINTSSGVKQCQGGPIQNNWPTGLPNASGPGAATTNTGTQVTGQQPFNPLASPFETGSNLTLPTGMTSLCDLLPAGTARDICKGTITTFTNPTTSTPSGTGTCPKGYHWVNGKGCVIDGVGSYIPGDVGKPDVIYSPVMGRFGQGSTPILVQQQKRVCPSGMVLGKDGVCYEHLARTNRAHNPGTKPLLTGGDMNALRKAKALEKRWRKLAPAFHKKVVATGAKLVKTRRK